MYFCRSYEKFSRYTKLPFTFSRKENLYVQLYTYVYINTCLTRLTRTFILTFENKHTTATEKDFITKTLPKHDAFGELHIEL